MAIIEKVTHTGQKSLSTLGGQIRFDEASARFVFNDGNTDRWFVGRDLQGNLKFKMSQPGYDVFTCPDEKLIMSSDFNMFKILDTGTLIMSGYDGTSETGPPPTIIRVAHNFDFAPTVECYAYISGSGIGEPYRVPLPHTEPGDFGGQLSVGQAIAWQLGVRTYADNVTFILNSENYDTTGIEFDIRYYFKQETAATS